MPDSKPLIVTCIQERLHNSVLTVRVEGRIVGRILLDQPGEWIILPPSPPKPDARRFTSIEGAVQALLTPTVPAEPR